MTAAPAGHEPLDEAALARLRELDPDGRHGVVVRVLTTFESSLTRMLQQLGAERAGGDGAAVARVAHTLKSSSASVGALPLSRACSEVEQRLRAGTPGHLDAEIDRLFAEGQAALVAVATILRPSGPPSA